MVYRSFLQRNFTSYSCGWLQWEAWSLWTLDLAGRFQPEIGHLEVQSFRSCTNSGEATRPDCSDLSVGEEMSKGSASKSFMHASRSWTACSSFFILAGWHSTCCLWRRWHLRLFFTVEFTLATLFAFLVVENSCFSLCRSWIHPCFSFEFRFKVVSIQRSSGWGVR